METAGDVLLERLLVSSTARVAPSGCRRRATWRWETPSSSSNGTSGTICRLGLRRPTEISALNSGKMRSGVAAGASETAGSTDTRSSRRGVGVVVTGADSEETAGGIGFGGRFVDLGGSTGQPGLFATNPGLNFQAGVTPNLSFLYVSTGTLLNAATPTSETARVTIGSLSFDVTTSSGAFQPFSRDFSFPVTTAAPRTFLDRGTDNSGLGIDRVMVRSVVPEPGPLALRDRRDARGRRGVAVAAACGSPVTVPSTSDKAGE